MTVRPTISFAKFSVPKKGSVVLLCAEGGALGGKAGGFDPAGRLARAFKVADFSGKSGSAVEVVAPEGSQLDRLVAVGVGKPANLKEFDWLKLGGVVAAQFRKTAEVAVVLDLPDAAIGAAEAAGLASGILLRAYGFDKYKTKKDDADGKPAEQKPSKFVIQCASPAAARKAFADAEAVADGVMLARDLVNEPANKLGPVEFAAAAKALAQLGVAVEVLTEKEMTKLGMGALLGVAQGSPRGARLVVMRWNGGKPKDSPVAFVGKGVTFDTGGISIKPAAGMEQMTMDMGGAAAVVATVILAARLGLDLTVVGTVPMAENMPSSTAYRPGDVLTMYGGTTVEVKNTDAEGRLILADAIVRACEDSPSHLIDTATLTGAQMVALGKKTPGVMGTEDFRDRVADLSRSVGEGGWPMPLPEELRAGLDSEVADLTHVTPHRWGGMLSAGLFLSEFVADGVEWAHIDVAGPAYNDGGPEGYLPKGGTGVPVRTMLAVLEDIAAGA